MLTENKVNILILDEERWEFFLQERGSYMLMILLDTLIITNKKDRSFRYFKDRNNGNNEHHAYPIEELDAHITFRRAATH